MNSLFKKNSQGAAALLSILVVGAIAVLTSSQLAIIGRSDLTIINNNIFASVAATNAEVCLADALRQVQLGVDDLELNLNINGGTCSLSMHQVGNNYAIISEGRKQDYVKVIHIQASQHNGKLEIDAWENK